MRTVKHLSMLMLLMGPLTLSGCSTKVFEPSAPGQEGFVEGPPLARGAFKADGLSSDLKAYAALPAGADLDGQFHALFSPDDPVATVETTFIDRVRKARLADSKDYAEGQNPYRIRYAVYNLRNERITGRLVAAHKAGVDVQILLESDQLDPARTWNTMDEHLVQQGFELARDHRKLDAAGRRSADLVGIKASGLMHLKARIFQTPAWSAVLSGSLNPGDHAMANEETLHLIRETRLVARYAAAYEAVLEGRKLTNQWDSGRAVNVMFTPVSKGPRAVTRVLRWIQQEQEQILLMVFSLRDVTAPGVTSSLVDILAAKVAAGVPVFVITDRKQSDGVDASGKQITYNDNTEDRLRKAGVHVYEAVNDATPYTAMHHKVAVLGRTKIRVITDAANWTKAGLGSSSRKARNVESVLFIDGDGRSGQRYLAQWMRVLRRYAHQGAMDGEPDAAWVYEQLSKKPGWPVQGLTFTAHQVHTAYGERAWVRGDHEALGAWGDGHRGVSLDTTSATYPTWSTDKAAQLPLGAALQWKLVAGYPKAKVRWERGNNRRALAGPPALSKDRELRLVGTWR